MSVKARWWKNHNNKEELENKHEIRPQLPLVAAILDFVIANCHVYPYVAHTAQFIITSLSFNGEWWPCLQYAFSGIPSQNYCCDIQLKQGKSQFYENKDTINLSSS